MTIVCEECGGSMGFVITDEGKKLKCNECGHVQSMPTRSDESTKAFDELKERLEDRFHS